MARQFPHGWRAAFFMPFEKVCHSFVTDKPANPYEYWADNLTFNQVVRGSNPRTLMALK